MRDGNDRRAGHRQSAQHRHVPAEPLGDQGGTHFSSGRGNANRAEHRLQRQLNLEIAEPGFEPDRIALGVDVVDPGGVGQRILQEGGAPLSASAGGSGIPERIAKKLQDNLLRMKSAAGEKYASIADEWEDPAGVVIDAIIMGGRRASGCGASLRPRGPADGRDCLPDADRHQRLCDLR